MNKFSDNLLEKIQEEQIEPKSKWSFIAKDGFIWGLGIASLILGAVALSVMTSILRNTDLSFAESLGHSLPKFLFLVLPYLWIVLLGVFLVVAHHQVRKTKSGYKYKLPVVLLALFGGSILLGGFLYQVGIGQALDERFVEKSPMYRQIANRKVNLLTNPEKGVLAGRVIEVASEELLLEDIKKKTWRVDVTKAVLPQDRTIPEGAMIKMTGQLEGEAFIADRISPLRPKDKLRDNFQEIRKVKEGMAPLRRR